MPVLYVFIQHAEGTIGYTRASSIEAANKNVETPGPSNETSNLRSEGESFDFKTHCLLCAEEAKPPDVKLPSAQVPMH